MSTCVKNSNQPKAQQAQWNVQVVRGKVTTRCLWNACKALSIGLLLLTIGTTMAVIGYYADQLSIRSETRGNSTVRIRNESRGFHLNNLSYAGPIVMGVGGFIVVAACVMTFEARDSAAKVVPARFKASANASVTADSVRTTPRAPRSFQGAGSQRSAGVQTPSGGRSERRAGGLQGADSTASGSEWSPKNDCTGRRAFTAAFVQFSRELLESSAFEGKSNERRRWKRGVGEAAMSKSPSAPDLQGQEEGRGGLSALGQGPGGRRGAGRGSAGTGTRSQRETVRPLETVSSNLLLRPNYLQRQALSVDNPFYDSYDCCTPPSVRLSRQPSRRSGGSRESFEMELGSSAGVSGSQTSMALDLHDCQVTLKVKDESASKRSDTARRHQLLRQRPVEDDSASKCSCVPRFLYASSGDRCTVRTKSSTSLRSPCHHCRKTAGYCCGQSEITTEFRSQSFSHTCSRGDCITCPNRLSSEDSPQVFCIDDHRRTNRSSENLGSCCARSPAKSPRGGPRCLLHGTVNCPPARKDVRKRREHRKMEGSLSAEEQGTSHRGHRRSGSYSPTGTGVLPRREETFEEVL